ncbi:amidohydrolase family protein [Streptomyces sp. NPDC093060]|uniref:amidohydrolase family protein n=1 Tax=Streptomyces sp. NPDC093060 TaxID=3366019 RepID=UPI0038161890
MRVHPGRPHRQLVAPARRGARRARVPLPSSVGGRSPGRPRSDWPIAPYPPLQVMAGARHRRPADLSLPPHGPDQALTALQALQGITVNAAWAAGEEHLAGRLAVGRRADLTVLAENPLEVPDTELTDLPVVLTVLAGRPTHRAADL